MEERLEKVKWAFYGWLGSLSIQEILNNITLMKNVERVELLLKKIKV